MDLVSRKTETGVEWVFRLETNEMEELPPNVPLCLGPIGASVAGNLMAVARLAQIIEDHLRGRE